MNPSPQTVISFWTYLMDKYGSQVRSKWEAEEMLLIAKALDLMGITEQKDFLSRFVTTIGSFIYTPFIAGTPTDEFGLWDQIVVCAHEHQHIIQSRKGLGLDFALRYLTDPVWRAAYEGEAYRVSMTLEHWHRGKMPPLEPYLKAMQSYGLPLDYLDFFRRCLELSVPVISAGGIPDEAAKVAIDWLEQNAPELKAA